MSLSIRRYRWLRAVFGILLIGGILIGQTEIISYDLGEPMWSQTDDQTPLSDETPARVWHPRETLFPHYSDRSE